jgi:hypothetical protein
MALVVVLAVLATFRLTRFLVDDELARPLRDAVERRMGVESSWAYLVSCPWCVSPYMGSLVAWVALVGHDWLPVQIVGIALAASAVTGLVYVLLPEKA